LTNYVNHEKLDLIRPQIVEDSSKKT
jgi:hypothetical protein